MLNGSKAVLLNFFFRGGTAEVIENEKQNYE
jgi:hypothetical protein